jgi:hypothetical protein
VLAAIALIVAALGCFSYRPWSRRRFVVARLTLGRTALAQFLLNYLPLLFSGGFTPAVRSLLFVRGAGGVLLSLVLPALLVWFMTRPATRTAFGSA